MLVGVLVAEERESGALSVSLNAADASCGVARAIERMNSVENRPKTEIFMLSLSVAGYRWDEERIVVAYPVGGQKMAL